jgi:hypothetical protein
MYSIFASLAQLCSNGENKTSHQKSYKNLSFFLILRHSEEVKGDTGRWKKNVLFPPLYFFIFSLFFCSLFRIFSPRAFLGNFFFFGGGDYNQIFSHPLISSGRISKKGSFIAVCVYKSKEYIYLAKKFLRVCFKKTLLYLFLNTL